MKQLKKQLTVLLHWRKPVVSFSVAKDLSLILREMDFDDEFPQETWERKKQYAVFSLSGYNQ